MKILAIGTSNNRHSINRTLAHYAAELVAGAEVEVIDIHDYEMPIFSDEREERFGQPLQARKLFRKISEADGLVISFAEHNGSYTAAYKNLFDWVSRIDGRVFQDKPGVYLATSPGAGGAKSVLESAVESAHFFGADLVGHMSIPKFHANFDQESGKLVNEGLRSQLARLMEELGRRMSGSERLQAIAATAGFPFK